MYLWKLPLVNNMSKYSFRSYWILQQLLPLKIARSKWPWTLRQSFKIKCAELQLVLMLFLFGVVPEIVLVLNQGQRAISVARVCYLRNEPPNASTLSLRTARWRPTAFPRPKPPPFRASSPRPTSHTPFVMLERRPAHRARPLPRSYWNLSSCDNCVVAPRAVQLFGIGDAAGRLGSCEIYRVF